MFKYYSPEIQWNPKVHGLVIPSQFPNISRAVLGMYIHYKIHNFDPGSINNKTGRFADSTWSGLHLLNHSHNHTSGFDIYSHYNVGDPVPPLCSSLMNEYCTTSAKPSKSNVPCNRLHLITAYQTAEIKNISSHRRNRR